MLLNEKRLAIVNRFHASHSDELAIVEKRNLKQKNPKQEEKMLGHFRGNSTYLLNEIVVTFATTQKYSFASCYWQAFAVIKFSYQKLYTKPRF